MRATELHWVVVAWDHAARGAIVDYGIFGVPPSGSVDLQIAASLRTLLKTITSAVRASGHPLDRGWVDRGWIPAAVGGACRKAGKPWESALGPRVTGTVFLRSSKRYVACADRSLLFTSIRVELFIVVDPRRL